MKRSTIYLLLFIIVSATELLAQVYGWQLVHAVAKSLILPSLIGYYLSLATKRSFTFVRALVACWAGDVLLLFQAESEMFFTLGLLAFLAGHFLYVVVYRNFQWNDKSHELQIAQKIRFSLPVVLVGTGLIVILFPTLGALEVPVFVYAIVLMLMVMTALFRHGRTTPTSFWLVFAGAAIFMLSDSLLAINKFYSPLYRAEILVMITYIAAQYLIVQGVLRHRFKK